MNGKFHRFVAEPGQSTRWNQQPKMIKYQEVVAQAQTLSKPTNPDVQVSVHTVPYFREAYPSHRFTYSNACTHTNMHMHAHSSVSFLQTSPSYNGVLLGPVPCVLDQCPQSPPPPCATLELRGPTGSHCEEEMPKGINERFQRIEESHITPEQQEPDWKAGPAIVLKPVKSELEHCWVTWSVKLDAPGSGRRTPLVKGILCSQLHGLWVSDGPHSGNYGEPRTHI